MSDADKYLHNPYRRQFYDRAIQLPPFRLLYDTAKSKNFDHQWLLHLPINIVVFLALVALFAFGPGYQPIAVTFIPTLCLMLAYGRSTPNKWSLLVLVFPAISIGTFFAYAGTLAEESGPWQSQSTVYMIPFALVWGAAITICIWADRMIADFSRVLLSFIEIFFAFPILWSGMWTFIYRVSPYGDFGNWGHALTLINVEDFTTGVAWLLGSVPGGSFCMGLIASALLYCIRRYFEVVDPEEVYEGELTLTPPPLQ